MCPREFVCVFCLPIQYIGRLVMMWWNWRLRTAASTGLLFISWWFAMWTMVWWYWLRLTPNVSTRALWQPSVLSGSPVSGEISGSHQYCLAGLSAEKSLAATSTVWQACQQRNLWQPPVLSGGPAIRDIAGASGRVGKGNENLVYPHPWDFKRDFTCRKILRHETSGFTSHPKEGVLRIFIALKNPSPWRCSNPQPLGPVASTLITTPPLSTIF
jgi:hypothetical protein